MQARYLLESLDVFDASGVHGAFAFTYVMPTFPRDAADAAHDLDMAGFGIVTAPAGERKAAFDALARRYAR